ncbi:MAG: protein phosphatase 2C domain-containing protein [Deltaproteobacteria bacterium]|jgi:protein phosphatase|nr:protein phosphatase 2C domain-containing protein [Deltaproteobacteria bacterium]
MTTIFFTNSGPERPANEDAILVGPVYADLSMDQPMVALGNEELVAVADGMGGGPGGATAARVVLEDLKLNLAPHGQAESRKTQPNRQDLLLECLYGAIDRLDRLSRDRPELAGMGATLAGLWRQGQSALVFNCGDCRVYRLRDDYLELLSRDHSAVYNLYLEGLISFDQIRFHPDKNLITSAIQQANHNLDLFSRVVRLCQDDLYLICSDGAWESLSQESLEDCLKNLSLEESALALAQALLAQNRGDNFSFLLQKVELLD